MQQQEKRGRIADMDQFRLLVEQAAIGIEQVGADGTIIEANHALCARLGYSREELIGRRSMELLDPDNRVATVRMHRDLFAG